MFKKSCTYFFVFFVLLFCFSLAIFAQTTDNESKISFIEQIKQWYDMNMSYTVIMLLMLLESSVLSALPSELIVALAAFSASEPDTVITVWGVWFFATLGSVLGALINYGVAIWLGRKAIYAFADSRIGRLFLLSSPRLIKAEAWFVRYSKFSVCIGRLVPAVRLLISIPAGLSRMNVASFLFYTFLGTGAWNLILAIMGNLLHGQSGSIEKYSSELGYMIAVLLILFLIFYFTKRMLKKRKKGKKARHFGLLGYPLGHSFSKRYFTDKFKTEKIDAIYRLFELENVEKMLDEIKNDPQLEGFNITKPHKESFIPLLDTLDETAAEIGAVNVVKITRDEDNKIYLKGYNTDIYGFEQSIKPYIEPRMKRALLLGGGGAAKAIIYALKQMNINVTQVSRTKKTDNLTYEEIDETVIFEHLLIINATPLGTFPHINDCPSISYEFLTPEHLLFDVVYNPGETLFLRRGRECGARGINGSKMLVEQARKAWKIWNE